MRRFSLLAFALLLLAAACGDDSTVTTDPGGDTPDGGDIDDTPDDGDEPPLGAGPYPIADLTVTITHPDVETVMYRISCLGDTATLIGGPSGLRDATVCARLALPEVQQLLSDGSLADRICTQIYGGPDVARITGTLDGNAIDASIDRANGCGIHDWDITLAGVLPPALGVTR